MTSTVRRAGLSRARVAGSGSEIASHPVPISGCDTHFAHLLVLRQRVCDAIAPLEREVRIPTSRDP